jgi:formylglycine-generating enzyme required for sulfatase activity
MVLLVLLMFAGCSTGRGPRPLEFGFVKGGCYQMGDALGEGAADEKPAHEVCVTDFYLSIHEVTQHQWEQVMGNNPSFHKECGSDCPVDFVSWTDVQDFIAKVNATSGKKYRLPTEAEWEYAARSGGKQERWSGTNDGAALGDYAWFAKNAEPVTYPVGLKKPNALGLHDMTGNILEWCQDWYDPSYYAASPKIDPQGPAAGSKRVMRG